MVDIELSARGGIRLGNRDTVAGLDRQITRRVLAVLCLEGRPVAREQLAEIVWNDDPPATWDTALRGSVSRIRQAARDAGMTDPLRTSGGSYSLDPTLVVDVVEALAAVHHGEASLVSGDPALALAAATHAVDTLARPFLPADDGEWFDERRRVLEFAAIRALVVESRAASALGRHVEAVSAAVAVIERDGLYEDGHLCLMSAHAAAGNRPGALAAYRRWRQVLGDELGIEPSERTEQLHRELLGGEDPDASTGRNDETAGEDLDALVDRAHEHVTQAVEAITRNDIASHREHLRDAARLALRARRPDLMVDLAGRLRPLEGPVPDPEMIGLVEALLDLAPGRTVTRAVLLMWLGCEQARHGDADLTDASAEEAIAIARHLGQPELLQAALLVSHFEAFGRHHPSVTAASMREVLALDTGSTTSSAHAKVATVRLAADLIDLGDGAGAHVALGPFASAVGIDSVAGADIIDWYGVRLSVVLAVAEGRWPDVDDLLGRSERVAKAIGAEESTFVNIGQRAGAMFHRTDLSPLRDMAAAFAATPGSVAFMQASAALFDVLTGHADSQQSLPRALATLADMPQWPSYWASMTITAEAAARSGHPARAELANTLLERSGCHAAMNGVSYFGPVDRVIALLVVDEDPEQAEELFRAAEAQCRTMRAGPYLALTLIDHAAFLRRQDPASGADAARPLEAEAAELIERFDLFLARNRLAAQVEADGPAASPLPRQPAGNLPRPQTDRVGDLVDLQRHVASLADHQLVTLTGSGGVGKTRAAIEIGWLVLDEYPGGAWLVELAPIADPDQIESAIASGLGVQPQPGLSLVESIVDWCTGRSVLLIIDNCEHVLEPAVDVIQAIVAGCATATVLATSREPLAIAGERVVRIPPLDEEHGLELFRIRAEAVGAAMTGSPREEDAIRAICARLDGIPLAIEIAAARTRSLAPTELLARLDDRFRLLRGPERSGTKRHQTLRATVTWSYELLTGQQQMLFDRLSVFAGDFDLLAVEVVCSDDALDEIDMVDRLGELVDKSMVTAERTGDVTRYRLLETLRQYGEERLGDRGETAVMNDRHLTHFAGLSREIWDEYLTPAQSLADATITAEWDNLRAAHGWAITQKRLGDAVAIVAAIHHHARNRMLNEVSDWVDQTMVLAEEQGDGGYLALALALGSDWARIRSDMDRSRALAERSWTLATTQDLKLDLRASATVRAMYLGAVVLGSSEATAAVEDAHEALAAIEDAAARWTILEGMLDAHTDADLIAIETEQILDAARHTGSPMAIAEAARLDGNRMTFHLTPPDYTGAIERHRESAAWAASDGSVTIEGWAKSNLAAAAILGGTTEAVDLAQELLRFSNEIHHPLMLDNAFTTAAFYLASRSELIPAAVILGNLDKRESCLAMEAIGRAAARAAASELDDFEVHLARGAAMNRPELVAFTQAALAGLEATSDAQPIELPR